MSEALSDNEDDIVSPPWGALPTEQYLIRNWKWESTDSPAVQRLKLIRRFLDLPEIDDDLDALGSHRNRWGSQLSWSQQHLWPGMDTIIVSRPPTAQEVERILKPWRPMRLRRRAVGFWMNRPWSGDEAIWLRTYYGPGSDALWEQFLEKEEDENPRFDEPLDVRFLSDETCFSLGSNWDLLLDLLPEARGYPHHDSRTQYLNESHQRIIQILQSKEPRRFGDDFIQGWEDQVRSEVHLMQTHCYSNYIIVADEEAFVSNKLRLIFHDRMRTIVREGRIPVEEACMVTVYEMQGRIIEEYWTDESGTYCELGEKYLPDGEFGRTLYDLDDPALNQELWRVMAWDRQSEELYEADVAAE